MPLLNIIIYVSDTLTLILKDFMEASRNSHFIRIDSLAKILLKKGLNSFSHRYKVLKLNAEVRKALDFYTRHQREMENYLGYDFNEGLLECVLATEAVKGDIVELGTWRGGSSVLIALFLKDLGSKRTLYACDTFEGHPYNDEFGKDSVGRFSDTNVSHVLEKLRKFEVASRVKIVKGLFEDTLSMELSHKIFSLVFIDCALYQSTKYALEFLIPRMANDGIIALDDYLDSSFGVARAVNEQCGKRGLKVNLYPIPHIRISNHPTKGKT